MRDIFRSRFWSIFLWSSWRLVRDERCVYFGKMVYVSFVVHCVVFSDFYYLEERQNERTSSKVWRFKFWKLCWILVQCFIIKSNANFRGIEVNRETASKDITLKSCSNFLLLNSCLKIFQPQNHQVTKVYFRRKRPLLKGNFVLFPMSCLFLI